MHRTTGLITILLLYSTAVAATGMPSGPIQDVTVIDGIDTNVTAGDTDTVTMAFRNHARQSLPIYVAVTASSEQGIDGNEFTVDAGMHSDNGVDTTHTALSCAFTGHQSATEGLYLCTGERPVLPRTTQPSENTLYTTITSALNTMPGTYEFDVDLYSTLGIPADTPKKRVTSPYAFTRFAFTDMSVTLNTTTTANATVEPLHDVIVPPPANTTVVSGVAIDAPNTQVGANSTVTFNGTAMSTYTLPTVYRFDTEHGGWTQIDTAREDGTVTASINSSGVYGLFDPIEQEQQDDERDNRRDDRDDRTGGSSGASDGGDTYSPQTCDPDDWSCTAWSACTNGTQTRTCDRTRVCADAGSRPPEIRSCTTQNGTDTERDGSKPSDEDTSTPDGPVGDNTTGNDTNVQAGQHLSVSGMTGRVTQAAPTIGVIVMVLSLLAVLYVKWRNQI